MPVRFDPPSGTRDFLAAELEAREAAFGTIREVFGRYAFEPLQTPAFERLDVLMGKYGDEGDKLIFKILRRGEHEASGEADLALRYDMTVPLARVVAAYGSQLPTPYKRYTIGPVWRADRPGKGRYREFTQCDLDTVGSSSLLADAEVACAVCETRGRARRAVVHHAGELAAGAVRAAAGVRRGRGDRRRRAHHAGQAGQAEPGRGDQGTGRARAGSGQGGVAGGRADRPGRHRAGAAALQSNDEGAAGLEEIDTADLAGAQPGSAPSGSGSCRGWCAGCPTTPARSGR